MHRWVQKRHQRIDDHQAGVRLFEGIIEQLQPAGKPEVLLAPFALLQHIERAQVSSQGCKPVASLATNLCPFGAKTATDLRHFLVPLVSRVGRQARANPVRLLQQLHQHIRLIALQGLLELLQPFAKPGQGGQEGFAILLEDATP